MPSLYELADDIRALDALLDECGGELDTPEVEAAWLSMMEQLRDDEAVKLDNCVNYIRTLDMEAAAARAEADQYLAKAKTRENRIAWLKSRLKDYLAITARKEVRTATNRVIAVQGNGGAMPVKLADNLDPATIPDEFALVKRTPDTEAIRKHLQAGGTLPFAELAPRGSSLRIR